MDLQRLRLEWPSYCIATVVTLILGLCKDVILWRRWLFILCFCGIWSITFCVVNTLRICMTKIDSLFCSRAENVIELEIIQNDTVDCSICLETCGKCVQLDCGHYFHMHCINTWMEEIPLGIEATCPNCRAEIA